MAEDGKHNDGSADDSTPNTSGLHAGFKRKFSDADVIPI
jgi:hypothetical protein